VLKKSNYKIISYTKSFIKLLLTIATSISSKYSKTLVIFFNYTYN